MNVLGFCRDSCKLLLLLLLLFDFGGLLTLHGWSADFHTENDISHFTAGKTGSIDIVLLAIIIQDEISQLRFNLDPVLIR